MPLYSDFATSAGDQLGVVQLTLDFGGVEKEFSVSPLHATLIMHFEGKAEVNVCVVVAVMPRCCTSAYNFGVVLFYSRS